MTACLSRIAFVSLLPAVALLVACVTPPTPTAQSVANTSVMVQFIEPSRFSEVRNARHQGQSENKAWMDALSKHLEQRAPRYLEPNTHLIVQITDVKLAGEYEPWRRAALDNVRIVRDIYPPRIELNFQLTDNANQTLKQGSSKLREPAFLMQAHRYPNDPLRYEKNMLDNWLRQEFGKD